MTGDRFAVIRYRPPTENQLTGVVTPGWEVLASVLFASAELAHDFAGKLDHARVFRLVPEPRRPAPNDEPGPPPENPGPATTMTRTRRAGDLGR